MTGNQPRPIAPAIEALLDDLRRRIRRYVWIEGAATALAVLGGALWASLLIDWSFEPSTSARAVLLLAAAALLAGAIVQTIVRRLLVPLHDRSMALLVERYFPQFQDRLLTVVELGERPAAPEEVNPEMLARTSRQAVEPLGSVDLGRVFNPWPVRRSVLAAIALLGAFAVFGAVAGDSLGVWARRSLLFSQELWPRRVKLLVEGFDDGVRKVAEGEDVTLVVRSDASMPERPERVEVRYRVEGGSPKRETMKREGDTFYFTFPKVQYDIALDVRGGDDARRGLRIVVVKSPMLVQLQIQRKYPGYIPPPTDDPIDAAESAKLPRGTAVVVHAEANKPLQSIRVAMLEGKTPRATRTLEPNEDNPLAFQVDVPAIAQETTLEFTLTDEDGITGSPRKLKLVGVEDRPPEFDLRMRGIGTAITPQARLPVAGRVSDDYGVADAWFVMVANGAAIGERRVDEARRKTLFGPAEVALSDRIELEPLGLKPGQVFKLRAKAVDFFNLDGQSPHEGQFDSPDLEVVTPQELRARLQKRERDIRERFQVIVRNIEDVRDALARIDFAPSGKPEDKPPATAPGDDQRLRAQSAGQTVKQAATETSSVAWEMDDILAQLSNNQTDPEGQARLKEGVLAPLRRIVDQQLPELDRRIDALQAAAENSTTGVEARDRAVRQADAVLTTMQQVLARMLAKEDLSQAIKLLRELIEKQRKVHEQTQQRHKGGLKDLKDLKD